MTTTINKKKKQYYNGDIFLVKPDKKYIVSLVWGFFSSLCLWAAPPSVYPNERELTSTEIPLGNLTSPDGALTVRLFQQDGITYYDVQRSGLAVLEASELGIRHSETDMYKNWRLIESPDARLKTEDYNLTVGKKRVISKKYHERKWVFTDDNYNNITVIFRVFDDGIAFRYYFPYLDSQKETRFLQEYTTFNLPDKGEAWLQPYDSASTYTPAYERYFDNAIPIGQKSPHETGWAFPALFHANNQWILITESDLGKNYCGMHLQPDAENGHYRLRFPEKYEALEADKLSPTIQVVEWHSPWRVVITGKTLGDIIVSTLATDVARSAPKKDYSWVKPGRASWSWWSDWNSPKDTSQLKKFVNLASTMGWEYSLIDANWNMIKKGNADSIIAYAHRKKVGIWLWYNSGGSHNTVMEAPRDLIWDRNKRRIEFERISRLGVKGVKIDFFQSDKQFIIQQYIEILEDAADFKLMVNFHGCTIPRGWQRTYPHLMSLEAVKGAENYHFDPTYPDKAPAQNTILVSTRNVIGSMDYTPITLTDMKYPRKTTIAHELALATLFESGILHIADKPESFTLLPEALQYLKSIPSVWDDMRYLAGTPGKDMIIARRSGNSWYIAGINGENQVKEIEINLASLSLSASSNAVIIGDVKEKSDISVAKTTLQTILKIKFAAYGGCVVMVN